MAKASRRHNLRVAALVFITFASTASCTKRLQQGDGTLAGCALLATDPTGGQTGPLQIAGHLRDAAGAPVVGARVTLAGDAQASRTTDLSGGYRFHVQAGRYQLTVSGDCSFLSPTVAVQVVADTLTKDFTVAAGDCATSASSNLSTSGSVVAVQRAGKLLGTTYVNVTPQENAAAALSRLHDIATEIEAPSCSLMIANSPAIERRAMLSAPGPAALTGTSSGAGEWLNLTTAVALGDVVVRFESKLAPDASADVVNLFLSAARALSLEEISELRGP